MNANPRLLEITEIMRSEIWDELDVNLSVAFFTNWNLVKLRIQSLKAMGKNPTPYLDKVRHFYNNHKELINEAHSIVCGGLPEAEWFERYIGCAKVIAEE